MNEEEKQAGERVTCKDCGALWKETWAKQGFHGCLNCWELAIERDYPELCSVQILTASLPLPKFEYEHKMDWDEVFKKKEER